MGPSRRPIPAELTVGSIGLSQVKTVHQWSTVPCKPTNNIQRPRDFMNLPNHPFPLVLLCHVLVKKHDLALRGRDDSGDVVDDLLGLGCLAGEVCYRKRNGNKVNDAF